MADRLPLLVFPSARTIQPPGGRPVPRGTPHVPGRARQVERLSEQLGVFQQDFAQYRASASGAVAGLEPETVLVIEIAGSVDDFRQAVEATEGLEWLGEWDVDDIEPNDEFYEEPRFGIDFFKNKVEGITRREQSREIRDLLIDHGIIAGDGKLIVEEIPILALPEHLAHLSGAIVQAIANAKRSKRLSGRLFLSFVNEHGLHEILSLWQQWEQGRGLPFGKTKWKAVLDQTLTIRRWGIEETLGDTGLLDRWTDLLDPVNPAAPLHCQIELFYRRNGDKRRENEDTIRALLAEIGGHTTSPFLDIPNIAFHAVKAQMPVDQVRHLLDVVETPGADIDVQLFRFPGVMYFRPTGQSVESFGEEAGVQAGFPEGVPDLPPVAAILDGAPNLNHAALAGRLLFDDPDNLEAQYQPGERRHGSAMASLVVHGEPTDDGTAPLTSQVYHVPVMQPNQDARQFDRHEEHIPNHVFFEDRIERAVRRMFEGEGETPAQAPGVKLINLSIGDPDRPFIHTPSPLARLLDWLSWKYRVLFCVSAGNFGGGIDVGIAAAAFAALSDEEKVTHVLRCIEQQVSERRLLSPAESLNAITVGALHNDMSGDYTAAQRVDVLPSSLLFSPVSRFGHGFRRSVKPEIMFPGGRQLYRTPVRDADSLYTRDNGLREPGQQVAWDSTTRGELSQTVYTRGTSNATALATRSGARIYEVLAALQDEHGAPISDDLMAVLIKALLVHGAQQPDHVRTALTDTLRAAQNRRRAKEVVTRYMGYGAVDIERVLGCTEQRGTVLGCGEIQENQVHEYRFPLPVDLSGSRLWRRMVVTLAWFSPINPHHRHLREAKLTFAPVGKWDAVPLVLKRVGADHNQVARGTVQHEILEGEGQIDAYADDGHILLHVTCKTDATEHLDQAIPYGLAVTLEVAEGVNIPVYEQIRARIRPQVAIGAEVENR